MGLSKNLCQKGANLGLSKNLCQKGANLCQKKLHRILLLPLLICSQNCLVCSLVLDYRLDVRHRYVHGFVHIIYLRTVITVAVGITKMPKKIEHVDENKLQRKRSNQQVIHLISCITFLFIFFRMIKLSLRQKFHVEDQTSVVSKATYLLH